jgi:hypothetical protein
MCVLDIYGFILLQIGVILMSVDGVAIYGSVWSKTMGIININL